MEELLFLHSQTEITEMIFPYTLLLHCLKLLIECKRWFKSPISNLEKLRLEVHCILSCMNSLLVWASFPMLCRSMQVSFPITFVNMNFFYLQFHLPMYNLCRYKNGDRLSPEHQKTIVERLLPYHPTYETKIGCGVESIMVCASPFFIPLATRKNNNNNKKNLSLMWYCAFLCSMGNLVLPSWNRKHVSIHQHSLNLMKIIFQNHCFYKFAISNVIYSNELWYWW